MTGGDISKDRGDQDQETQRTRSDDGAYAHPGKPADFAEGPDASEDEAYDGGNDHKNGGTGSVGRDCVEADRNAEHTRSGYEDPIWWL